ncbi:MAG: BON domain-containing protein [Rhodospirillaceae bacterium]
MGNKWRNEDFNRWDEEEIRRSRGASRYDRPGQYSQEYSGGGQYGGDGDSNADRDWARRSREGVRRGGSDLASQYERASYSQPGTFYYGGTPQRRFGLGPGEPAFEGDSAPDEYGRDVGRTDFGEHMHGYGPSYGGYGSSYDQDSAFRAMGRFEREMHEDEERLRHNRTRDRDHDRGGHRTRDHGLFHDDPNRGPIDRLRNWMHHRGKGPKGYKRSDERIREDISDHLTQDYLVDATLIEVVVTDCECTLNGTVATRDEKRRAEDIAERVMGVRHVQNNLRVAPTATTPLSTQDRTGTMSTTIGSSPTLSSRSGSSNV